ncbi:hypothetical protein [Saliphagus sp. LR7]|nr:hypothetical protein [Saliphagus sp. LR7]
MRHDQLLEEASEIVADGLEDDPPMSDMIDTALPPRRSNRRPPT